VQAESAGMHTPSSLVREREREKAIHTIITTR
jgi:hypothetical protein